MTVVWIVPSWARAVQSMTKLSGEGVRPEIPRSMALPARTVCSDPSGVRSDCSSNASPIPGSARSAARIHPSRIRPCRIRPSS